MRCRGQRAAIRPTVYIPVAQLVMERMTPPNHELQRTGLSHFRLRLATVGQAACNPRVPRAGSLNCQAHDIAVLVTSRLLKPLGNPPANGVKYFATSLVLESTKDSMWLAKVTNAIHNYWRVKNPRKEQTPTEIAAKR